MKKLFTLMAAALICFAASAVPAKPGTHTFTQSDGSTITLKMVGDEFHHSLMTLDNLTVDLDENGDVYYRNIMGITAVRAHDPEQRSAAEASFVAQNAASLTLQALIPANDNRRRASANAPRRTQVPQVGTPHIPIILVNYTDYKFKSEDPVEVFETQFNSGDKSCLAYFTDQSRGMFTPQFDILGPVNLSHNRSYYGGNIGGNDKGVGLMVKEACDSLLAQGVDFSVYNNDTDDHVDVVVVLYAGVGEAQAYGIVPNSVWPCQWELSDSEVGDSLQAAEGLWIDKFAVFNELAGSSDATTIIDGVGTFCHEFSHCLGLPDYYDTRYGGHYGMGNWSLMDSGCYNDDGNTPCGYSAYDRNFMGWLDLITPEVDTQYDLAPLNTDEGTAVKIVNDADPNEYYILENRQKTGWDLYNPAAGMMVNHITYLRAAWDGNYVNDYNPQRMTILPADNQLNKYSEYGDLYPYNGNDSITDNSKPAAKVNTGNYLHKPITEITKVGNHVTFYFMKEFLVKKVPQLTDTTQIDSTSFMAHWTPVDNVLSYTLQLNRVKEGDELHYVEHIKETFPAEKFTSPGSIDISGELDNYMDNAGWTGSALFRDASAIRIGKSQGTGSLVSPQLDIDDSVDEITVVFDVHAYNNDNNVELTISCGENTKTVSIANSNTQHFSVILDVDHENPVVTFATTTNRKRAVVSSILVYSGEMPEVQGAPRRAIEETGDSLSRTITGITDTCYLATDLVANGLYKVKVKAVYTDETEGNWSDMWWVRLHSNGDTPQPQPLAGDVNLDGKVDGMDLNILINIVLGMDQAENYDGRANVDGDELGQVNGSDINTLINILLGIIPTE